MTKTYIGIEYAKNRTLLYNWVRVGEEKIRDEIIRNITGLGTGR